jgi:uncharacterized membrane protein (DUF106 family)
MSIINRCMTVVFDMVYAVLGPVSALVILSAMFGIVALIVIRYCSNQAAVARIKDAIKADMLAVKLFKDELRVMFLAVPRVIASAVKLQVHMVPPLLVMIGPMILVCAQMAAWHEWRALRVDEPAIVTVTLRPDAPTATLDLTPEPTESVTLSHRVRAASINQVSWNARGSLPGRHTLTFVVDGVPITKDLVIADDLTRVSPSRHNGAWVDSLLYPCESPLPAESIVQSVSVAYPPLDSWVYGSTWWLVWFLVISIVVALLLKPWLKVKL